MRIIMRLVLLTIPKTCYNITMKKPEYASLICEGFCKYYKPGKEESVCGSYRFLTDNLTVDEIRTLAKNAQRMPLYLRDDTIKDLACKKCEFLIDGCDYREETSLGNTPRSLPCGGYTLVETLLKSAL